MDNFNRKQLAAKSVTNAAFAKTNNAYPGQNMGLTLDRVKKMIDNAEKVTGTTFTTATGTVTPNVQLPSTAKFIKGFAIAGTINVADTFDLLINEERAISQGSAQAFHATNAKPAVKNYFDFKRPVASATALTINYNSAIAGNVIVLHVVYV
jgi:hypothetical protein